MVVDVEVTRQADGQYLARVLHIPDIAATATSRDAALHKIRALLDKRWRSGIELVQLDVGNVAASWPRHAGAFPDDDSYRAMLAAIEGERAALDQDDAA